MGQPADRHILRRVEAPETGFYTLHTQTVPETTDKDDAVTLSLNGFGTGILGPAATDEDYFKIELSQATDLMIRVAREHSEIDLEGALFDSDDKEIVVHDDSFLGGDFTNQFLIREQLDAGVYYLKIRSSPGATYQVCRGYTPEFVRTIWVNCPTEATKSLATDDGPYMVQAVEVAAPGSSTGSARELTLDQSAVVGGRIDRAGDADYFKITVGEPTHVKVRAVSATVETDGVLLDTGRREVSTLQSEQDFVPGGLGFLLYGSLQTGTSYIKVTGGDSAATGPYSIVAYEDTEYAGFLDRCAGIATDYDDPLYGCQWHLNNTGQNSGLSTGTVGEDINVEEVWDAGNLGEGANIAIVDSGLYYNHEDLTANVKRSRNHDYTGRGDVFERYFTHGTQMAGIIAGRDNNIGGRGVAPRATVYVHNVIRNQTVANFGDAMTRNMSDTWVSNNSWHHVSSPGLNRVPKIWELSIDAGVSNGLGGKGIFYAFSGGGGARVGDYSNLSEFANYYAVTAVCATNDQGEKTAYSEAGPNLWVCAPSSDLTVPRQGITTTQNYNRYEGASGGNSAATAIVSGVAALVRKANPDLTWRDVKLILAGSARKNDSADTGWENGAAKYGATTDTYNYNHEYGFGVVDAKAAVDLADGWTLLPPMRKHSVGTDSELNIPDTNSQVSNSVTVAAGSGIEFVEFVEVKALFDHLSFRDLKMELVSPAGKVSVLSEPPPSAANVDEEYPLTSGFRFGSARHLGEGPVGDWTLRVTDTVSGNQGAVESWSLTIYGHGEPSASPIITSVSPGSSSLTVAWTAPEDASTITAYDVRHIQTSADESVDSNWTVIDDAWTTGALEYTLTGLTNSTQYDVQVRAVDSNGDGDWSDTATSTPGISAGTVPTTTQLRADDKAVVVSWSAPTSTNLTVKAYDVRHIRNDASDKADANWTVADDAWTTESGDLYHAVTELENGVLYDVQVRAVDSNDMDGSWSPTFSVTPADYGDSVATATPLVLETTSSGRIAPLGDSRFWGALEAGESDYFKLELTRQQVSKNVGIWLYTLGDVDTEADLLDSDALPIDSNDDGNLSPSPRNFLIWRTLQAGTYYVRVGGYESAAGPYVFRVRTFTDTTGRGNAVDLPLDGSASGMLDPKGDEDYFKISLSADTTVILRSSGFPDTVGELQNSSGTSLDVNDDGQLPTGRYHFLINQSLTAGTYYLKVKGFDSFFDENVGPYSVYATSVTEPGSTTATAQPITLGEPAGGSIDPGDDEDYFSFTISASTDIVIRGISYDLDIDGVLLNSVGTEAPTDVSIDTGSDVGFTMYDRPDPGTYYIKVTGDNGTDTGRYTIMAVEDRSYTSLLDGCSNIDRSAGINDVLYGCQWHLNNTGQFRGGARQDINVEDVWPTYDGAGINVVVVDDGMQHDHEDLIANRNTALNHDYTGDNEIYNYFETHGTAVAGIIAARDNNVGMRGVAPKAKIYGYNLLLEDTAQNEGDAMSRNAVMSAISNNSWGPGDFGHPQHTNTFWTAGVQTGITEGFDGKGIFYAWAAGNGGRRGDYSNLDEYANYYAVTAVCAVNHLDVRSSYSEPGSNLWVCAPSNDSGTRGLPGIATTDNGNRYRDDFGGTSAATPIVSGVVALVREANGTLTWRDLKLILAASARKNDPSDSGWETGALKYGSTTDRYDFNQQYGFGMVDAKAAVDLAGSWTKVPATLRKATGSTGSIEQSIPDARSTSPGDTVTSTITIEPFVDFIEFVEVNAHFDHGYFRDLDVELVSPSGSVSKLVPHEKGLQGALASPFRFGSARHLGENPAGEWTLRVTDHVPGDQGTLRYWRLTVYGHGVLPSPPDIDETTLGEGSVTVVWKVPTDIGGSPVTSYDLRHIRSDATDTSDDQWTVQDDVDTDNDLSHTITGLDGGVKYDLQIRSVNSSGEGPWSEVHDATPEISPPSVPTISSVATGDRSLAVIWTAPSDSGGENPTSYDVRSIETSADETVDTNWILLTRIWTSGALNYTFSGLTNGTGYDVQVRAVNSAGDGDWSGTMTGTPEQEPVPVTLSLQVSTSVEEGIGTLSVSAFATTTVDVAPAANFSFAVFFETDDDGASAPNDYEKVSETPTFTGSDFSQTTISGQQRYRASKDFTVTIVDDQADEDDEDFTVTLGYQNPGLPHLRGGNAVGRVTILDDDHVPVTLDWAASPVIVNEGSGTVTLRALAITTKDKQPDTGFTFQATVSTSQGTATQADDYTHLSQTVTFQRSEFRRATVNGQQRYRAEKQVVVPIVDDTEDEPDEEFEVTLAYVGSSLPHLQGGPATAVVDIHDNDHVPVTIVWEGTTVTVDEDAGTITLEAAAVTTKDKAPESGFSFGVTVATADGSAEQSTDYRRLSTTATFRQADFSRGTVNSQARYGATKEFTISIREDTVDEPVETSLSPCRTRTHPSPTSKEEARPQLSISSTTTTHRLRWLRMQQRQMRVTHPSPSPYSGIESRTYH